MMRAFRSSTINRSHKKISHHLVMLCGLNSTRPLARYSSVVSKHSNQHQDLRSWNKKISHLIRTGKINQAKIVFDQLSHRNTITYNSMISGYVKNAQIPNARKLFDEMPRRDVVSWNLIISGYLLGNRDVEQARFLFDKMPERDLVSWNTMISGYARNGRMGDAFWLFERMPERNVVSWNAMITGLLQNGDVLKAIDLFRRMPERDSASVSALVSGLIRNGELDEAAKILFEIGKVEDGQKDLVHAYNTLIVGYGTSGRVDEARRVFDWILVSTRGEIGRLARNVVSWNSMIMCYVKAGDVVEARKLFDQMRVRDIISWNTMINGYVNKSDMEEASALFNGMPGPDVCSWNSMVTGYAQKGDLDHARDFFDRMPEKSLISWNCMIAGYEQNGNYEEAIGLFHQMHVKGKSPDRHTLSSVLGACAGLAALNQGMAVHQRIIKTVVADIPINNSLITMYSRCGLVAEARAAFDEMKLQRDVVSWNAIIGGYASQGYAMEALMLYEEMMRQKVQPTHITFISVLSACSHAGLVEEGIKKFKSMVSEFGIEPRVEHFASLVDIVGRQGHLEDALNLINSMPIEPDRAVWGALLGACRVHNNVDLARVSAEALMKIEPESSAPYALLYNMHADAGRWDDALGVRKMMEKKGVRKQPGYSWIDLHNKVHIFVASDKSHPLANEIHELTKSCDRIIKDLDLLKDFL